MSPAERIDGSAERAGLVAPEERPFLLAQTLSTGHPVDFQSVQSSAHAYSIPTDRQNPMSVVFAGQGSQRCGMARDFFDAFSVCREVFDIASNAIGVDIETICFQETELINLTKYTQPAILTAEIAIFEALKKHFGLQAQLFAGHSLGEYAALVAARVIPFELAVEIVYRRGELMQEAVAHGEGAMAAVLHHGVDRDLILAVASKYGVELSNFNTEYQTVVSGRRRDIENMTRYVKEELPTVETQYLRVNAPFHSSYLKNIEKEFRRYLESLAHRFSPQNVRSVLSNYTGGVHVECGLVDNLACQISSSVLWEKNMHVLIGARLPILEVSPAPVLRSFFSSLGIKVPAVFDLRSCRKIFKNERRANTF